MFRVTMIGASQNISEQACMLLSKHCHGDLIPLVRMFVLHHHCNHEIEIEQNCTDSTGSHET